MRIDQPEPGDPSDLGDLGDLGDPRGRGPSERALPGGTEAAPERTARRESETAPDRTPRHETETETAPERKSQHNTEPAPDTAARQAAKAPVSQADQIAEHLRYRETVSFRMQAAAGRDAWAEALPQLRAAWAEQKDRYPEQPHARPRTEADGSWVCGKRKLDPEQNAEAGKAHADLADEARGHILPALRRVEAADPDRQLAGLEHMVKGEDRLKEKLADELDGKNKTVREALNEVPDAVRFTLRYDSGRYSDGVLADIERLTAEGFKLIKLKKLWDGDQYKGVNSQWRRPETRSRFEMQFHTFESLEAKELTHEAYERIRSSTTSPAERRAAKAFQRRVNAALRTPPGIDRIKDYAEKDDA